MTSPFTQEQQTTLLYKKYVGSSDAYPATANYSNEPQSNARQRIYPSIQLCAQEIPSVAPTDLVRDFTFPSGNGQRWTSSQYPWVVRYINTSLKSILAGLSFWFINTDPTNLSTNILSNSIPFNYDPLGSYFIQVLDPSKPVGSQAIAPSDATTPWNFDQDVGVLTFFPANLTPLPGSFTPLISYWRYEGAFGLTSSGNGSTGPTGPAGSSETSSIPPVAMVNPIITPMSIYIPINYPSQTYTSNYPQPIPTIVSSIFNISYINSDGNQINNELLNTGTIPFDSNYVRPLSNNSTGPLTNNPLRGIILQNSSDSNETLTPSLNPFYFYIDATGSIGITGPTGVWSIIYNITTGSNSTNNYITGSYVNYAGTGSPTGIYFGKFSNLTPSSSDAYLSMTGAPTNSSITLDILPPTQNNIGPVQDVTILSYNGGYYTKGSSLLYGGPVPHGSSGTNIQFSGNPIPYTGPHTIYTQNNLYPDCYYQFNIKSTNSLNVTSSNTYSYIGYTGPSPTLYINPLINATDVNISNSTGFFTTPFVSNAYSVATSTPVTNLFNNTAINTTTFGPYSNNYDYTTRGMLGIADPGMIITCKVDDKIGPTANLYSFPLSNAGATALNNMTLSYGPSTDQYNGITGSAGFYSQRTFSISMTGITGSPDLHMLNIGQKYNYFTSGGSSIDITYTGSTGFYYDKVIGYPIINSTLVSLTGPTGYVSGVNMNPFFKVTTNLSNMGNYFYNSPIINYNFSGGCTGTVNEPGLSNVTSSISGGILTNPVTVVNDYIQPILTQGLNTNVTLNLVANNIVSSTGTNITIASVIFDSGSYNLVNSAPKSIQILYSLLNPQYGYRVWSAPGGSVTNSNSTGYTGPLEYYYYPPPYGLNYNSEWYSYSLFPYQQTWNILSSSTPVPNYGTIDTSQEIQIFNGSYQTISNSGATGGYLNYSSYFGNSGVDYSSVPKGITSYRYATFVWRYIGVLNSINFFNFVFNNFKCNSGPVTLSTKNGCTFITNNGNTQRFFFNYRVEEIILETPFVVPNGLSTSNTTVWVDGNSNSYETNRLSTPNFGQIGVISNNNYNTPTDNSIMYGSTSNITYSSNNLNIKVGSILFKQNSNYYIYGRIGLPMIDNYSFSSVQLFLSTN